MNLLATRVHAADAPGQSKRAARYIIAAGESQADRTLAGSAEGTAAWNPLEIN